MCMYILYAFFNTVGVIFSSHLIKNTILFGSIFQYNEFWL